MDWEPTYTRKRKAEWYYAIDPKQRRFNSYPKEESKAHIYQLLESNESVTVKLTTLIRENEFEIFSEFLPCLVTSRIRYNTIDIGHAILDSANRKFHDFMTGRLHLVGPVEYLRSTIIPPNLTRFKRLEEYGSGPHPSIMLEVVATRCDATEILKYVLDKYQFAYYMCAHVAILTAREGCHDNLFAILNYLVEYDMYRIGLYHELRMIASKTRNSS